MKAIILTAGYGKRMRPLSDHCHKALLPVAGTTILGRILDSLGEIGVSEITIVTGYRADDLRAFIARHYSQLPIRWVHNPRYAETNNIVSLSLALDGIELDADVLLIECDLLFHPAVLQPLLSPSPGNIALVDQYRPGMDGTVVSVENGVITQVFPPHLQGEDFRYSDKFKTLNIYRFDRDFCRSVFQPLLNCYANLIDGNCYYELVLGMLVNMQRQSIRAVTVEGGSWAEVDDPNDLAVARFLFEPNRRAEVLDRGFGGHWNFDVLDFAFMRNAYFPTAAMMAAMRQALPGLVRGYGSSQPVLNEKLATFLLCPPQRLQMLNGASQIYPLLEQQFGDAVVLAPEPSFGEYGRIFPQRRTYADAPGIDLEALDAAAAQAGLVVIVNPNNPTGTTLPTAWLHAFAARHPHTRVLVDESFIDFSEEEPLLRRLEREPLENVIVLTSLSKTLGVPGLRLGYVYSSNEAWIAGLGRRIPIWNLGSPAEHMLELLLKFRPELEHSLQRTGQDRDGLAASLRELPFIAQVYPSGGNFLLARLAGDDSGLAARLRRHLLEHFRIDVKDVSGRFPDGRSCLRIAVRLPEENRRFLNALEQAAAALLP